eukprot:TRINITY_DN3888_c0_g1_i4.p1 TRINITY_DN3888_c0_g1~~TRINITY_DN3888_c0_g1_i4.p1  ORF type:complete len:408 (-),score=112.60 TRINITY_DN3888_c0_g1_i4:414-1577(-)
MSSRLFEIESRVSSKAQQIFLNFDMLKQQLKQGGTEGGSLGKISQLRTNVQELAKEAAALFYEGFQENGFVVVEDNQVSDELEAQEHSLKRDISTAVQNLCFVEQQMQMKQDELNAEKLKGSEIAEKLEKQKDSLECVMNSVFSLKKSEASLFSKQDELTKEIQTKEEELQRIDEEANQQKEQTLSSNEKQLWEVKKLLGVVRWFFDFSDVVPRNNNNLELLRQERKQEISRLKGKLEKLKNCSQSVVTSFSQLESQKCNIRADQMTSLDAQILSIKNQKRHQESLGVLKEKQRLLTRAKNNLQLKLACLQKKMALFRKDQKRSAKGSVSATLAEQAGFSIESYCLLLGFQVDLLHQLVSSAENGDIPVKRITVQLSAIEHMLSPLR